MVKKVVLSESGGDSDADDFEPQVLSKADTSSARLKAVKKTIP